MTAPERFWDRVAGWYARRPIADEDAYRHKLELTRRHLHPRAALLDLGCGTGTAAIAHAPFVERIVAVDASAKMLEIARSRAAA